MTTITSAQDGDWNTAGTWDTATVPTDADSVVINHNVTISTDASASDITIQTTGSLTTPDNWTMQNPITLTAGYIHLARVLDDDRVVRLDGANLVISSPSISSYGGTGFAEVNYDIRNTEGEIIIDDPGLYGFSSQMQDIKPEGCARAYARKVSNGVRYLNIVVHIRKDKSNKIGLLYRMAELPFQVLAVTNSAVIKGFIEAITPVDSVGKEYRTFRVSIAEGL